MSPSHAGLTDKGLARPHNEDRWIGDARQGLYVVADGMGGHSAGAVAAQLVVDTLPELLARASSADRARSSASDASLALGLGPILQKVLAETSEIIRRQSQGQPGLDGMGAAVVAAVVVPGIAVVGHLGDSRAYRWRPGSLEQLTRDHSLVQLLLDMKEITPTEAAHHPARGQLTRYVGMVTKPLPEARCVELRPGDRLLLCSDGLTGMLSDQQVRNILEHREGLAATCRQLVAEANAAGGVDNITVVLVEQG